MVVGLSIDECGVCVAVRGCVAPLLHGRTGVMVAYIDEDVLNVVKLATGGWTWAPTGKNVRAAGC